MTFDEIRQIALSFPEVAEQQIFGNPTFKIRKRFLASIAKIDADTLCIKVPNKLERDYLLSTKPEVYYMHEHYLTQSNTLSGGDVLPNFELAVADIFK